MLIFSERRINTIQIIDILKKTKNWGIKWSIHGEKGKFAREVAGKHKVIFKLSQITQNYQSIEVVQLNETSMIMEKVFVTLLLPVL